MAENSQHPEEQIEVVVDCILVNYRGDPESRAGLSTRSLSGQRSTRTSGTNCRHAASNVTKRWRKPPGQDITPLLSSHLRG